MSDLKKLKKIVEDHMFNSKASRDRAWDESDNDCYFLFKGEADVCHRILVVINEMISEKEG